MGENARAGVPGHLKVSPSPFVRSAEVQFSLPQSSPARVEVYDRAGRAVRVLHEAWTAAGVHSVVWDGRDARGSRAVAGVYLVRAVSPYGTATTPLVRTD